MASISVLGAEVIVANKKSEEQILKWVNANMNKPKLINAEIRDYSVFESSDYVLICRKMMGFKFYCVAKYIVVTFDYGSDEENVSEMWQTAESDNYIDTETVYYWAEIVDPERR